MKWAPAAFLLARRGNLGAGIRPPGLHSWLCDRVTYFLPSPHRKDPFRGLESQNHFYNKSKAVFAIFILIFSQVYIGIFEKLHDV